MEWKFDQTIAQIFSEHARQHIPDYDRVIDLSVDLCTQKVSVDSPILEIGCAIGETIKKLHHVGFSNLHAVDNSQAMLDQCPATMAKYYCSDQFPKISTKFKAILCNWTLHFIRDKNSYLQSCFDHMEPGGFLVLTEKTENTGLALEQYHHLKALNGVSDEQIKAKAESLIGVMFVDSVSWYLDTLKNIGFQQVYIANANWCFTTFVVVK
jgi:tRNA (cmo5U34)-methyltransferase